MRFFSKISVYFMIFRLRSKFYIVCVAISYIYRHMISEVSISLFGFPHLEYENGEVNLFYTIEKNLIWICNFDNCQYFGHSPQLHPIWETNIVKAANFRRVRLRNCRFGHKQRLDTRSPNISYKNHLFCSYRANFIVFFFRSLLS